MMHKDHVNREPMSLKDAEIEARKHLPSDRKIMWIHCPYGHQPCDIQCPAFVPPNINIVGEDDNNPPNNLYVVTGVYCSNRMLTSWRDENK
jgi:hypothetical protein